MTRRYHAHNDPASRTCQADLLPLVASIVGVAIKPSYVYLSAYTAVPGLTAKLWLADRATNTYGGVYIFSDADAQEAYANSELFAAVAGNPNLTGLTSRAFDVLAGPTAVTRGGLLDADRTPA